MTDDYRAVLGSMRGGRGPLRRGITTGTCAQAAAKAALLALDSRESLRAVEITLPAGKKAWSGRKISVPVDSIVIREDSATAVVVKDAGDDADITNGARIVATVRRRAEAGITIRGGKGVGVVTRPGLPVPVGEAAINPVPRAMIRAELESLAGQVRSGGIDVLIEIPEGEALAAKTWNPRIGVEGGLSIIGTSGVVEPASSSAFRRSIFRTAKAFAARGLREAAITPGYVGEKYLRRRGVSDDRILTVGDHVGFALDACGRLGFERIELVAHVGKLVKVAAGLFNTHSKFGDARLETLAAHAGAVGAGAAFINKLLGLKLAEEAVPLLREAGYAAVFERVARRASERSEERCGLSVACVVLDLNGGQLAVWPRRDEGAQQESSPCGLVVVGMGPGPTEYLIPQAREAAAMADVLAGDARHLEEMRRTFPGKRELPFTGKVEPFLDLLEEAGRSSRVALLVSGDPTLYSLGEAVRRRFALGVETVPGLSAFQLLCARVGIAWDDAELVSVHGRSLDRLEGLGERTAIIFCDQRNSPDVVAVRLALKLGPARRMVVGERIGYPDERLVDATIGEIAALRFGGLSTAILPR